MVRKIDLGHEASEALYQIERFTDGSVPFTGNSTRSVVLPERIGIVDDESEDDVYALIAPGEAPGLGGEGMGRNSTGKERLDNDVRVDIVEHSPPVERQWPLANGRLLQILRRGDINDGESLHLILSDTDQDGEPLDATSRSIRWDRWDDKEDRVVGYDPAEQKGKYLGRDGVKVLVLEFAKVIDSIEE